jgi:hypothetical protein
MATITWTVNIETTQHTVRLVHHTIDGKREIWVDQTLVEQGRKIVDYGSRHFLSIQGAEYELVVVTNGLTFAYYLLKDDRPIPSDQDRLKGKTAEDLLQTRYLRDLPFWQDLGDKLNLLNLPDHEADWVFRNRLIGLLKGYVILVDKRFLPGTTRLVWFVIVRHAHLRSTGSGTPMRSDSRILLLLGNLKKSRTAFESESDYTVIYMPYDKKETPAGLVVKVQTLLSVVAEHALPLVEDTCENSECKQPFTQDRKLILINGMPRLLCQDCIADIPGWGQKIEKQYKNAPNRLLAGLLAGTGAAILGAMIWAAVTIFIHRFFALIGPFILFGVIVWAMDKVRTKRTLFSLLICIVLTFLSINLGYLTINFGILLQRSYSPSWETVYTAWGTMLAKPATLRIAYLLTFLFTVFYLFNLAGQRKYLSGYFKPIVEVLPGKF